MLVERLALHLLKTNATSAKRQKAEHNKTRCGCKHRNITIETFKALPTVAVTQNVLDKCYFFSWLRGKK